MNTRLDKVIRSAGFGARKVYSLVLSDAALYIIHTGSIGALKHYRLDEATQRVVADASNDRSVAQIQSNETQIDLMLLDQLVGGDNYRVRLAAIEDVSVRSGKQPEMIVKVTGSDHRFTFPFTPIDQVLTLRAALLRQNDQVSSR
jgi:NAD kinase